MTLLSSPKRSQFSSLEGSPVSSPRLRSDLLAELPSSKDSAEDFFRAADSFKGMVAAEVRANSPLSDAPTVQAVSPTPLSNEEIATKLAKKLDISNPNFEPNTGSVDISSAGLDQLTDELIFFACDVQLIGSKTYSTDEVKSNLTNAIKNKYRDNYASKAASYDAERRTFLNNISASILYLKGNLERANRSNQKRSAPNIPAKRKTPSNQEREWKKFCEGNGGLAQQNQNNNQMLLALAVTGLSSSPDDLPYLPKADSEEAPIMATEATIPKKEADKLGKIADGFFETD